MVNETQFVVFTQNTALYYNMLHRFCNDHNKTLNKYIIVISEHIDYI